MHKQKEQMRYGLEEDDENSEENYINQEDIEIKDDDWEPTNEEILKFALKIGYDIDKDPEELFEIAYSYMKCQLPEGWKRAIYTFSLYNKAFPGKSFYPNRNDRLKYRLWKELDIVIHQNQEI